jgi:DNA polymerase-1
LDVHRLTALTAFGSLPEDEKSQEFKWVRNMGKQIAFGLIYGMGTRTLAIQIERDQDEAKMFMDKYFQRFKRARKFIDMVNKTVVDRGWIKDRYGRRRYLPANRSYVGVNFLIQGTAADMLKEALVKTRKALMPYKSRMLMNIHDEVCVEVHYDEADDVIPLVVEAMSWSSKIKLKMRVDVEWSPTRWSEKKSLACDTCEGRGLVIEGISQDELLRAMYRNDSEVINSVQTRACDECEGRGFTTKKIKEWLANNE